jgi:hypothetical protein
MFHLLNFIGELYEAGLELILKELNLTVFVQNIYSFVKYTYTGTFHS